VLGLRIGLAPFGHRLVTGLRRFADSKESNMNHDTLKNTIATLEKLRDAHCSQLDAGALAELDDVLQQLRNMLDGSERRELEHGELVFRALRITDIAIRAVSNLTDWMK
jgi:hypothetical protein